MAWLGLSLPIWITAAGALSPVTVRCTSVSLPEVADPHFGQVALVCWVSFRAPLPTLNGRSDGSTLKSDQPSLDSRSTVVATTRDERWAMMLTAEARR